MALDEQTLLGLGGSSDSGQQPQPDSVPVPQSPSPQYSFNYYSPLARAAAAGMGSDTGGGTTGMPQTQGDGQQALFGVPGTGAVGLPSAPGGGGGGWQSDPLTAAAVAAVGGNPQNRPVQREYDTDPLTGMSNFRMPEPDTFSRTGPVYTNPERFRPVGTGLWPSIFSPNAPASGWFTLHDLEAMQPNTAGENAGRWWAGDTALSNNQPVPGHPEYFIFNGQMINRNEIGPSLAKDEFPPFTGYQSGASLGYPIAFTNPGWQGATYYGYPGNAAGWFGGGGGST